jgi:hypothetical protein
LGYTTPQFVANVRYRTARYLFVISRDFTAFSLLRVLAGVFGAALNSGAMAEQGDSGPQPEAESSPLEWIKALPVPLEPAFPVAAPSNTAATSLKGPRGSIACKRPCTGPRVPPPSGLTAFSAAHA